MPWPWLTKCLNNDRAMVDECMRCCPTGPGCPAHGGPVQRISGRALVWKPAARFVDEKDLYETAEQDGIFARDPTLRDFLVPL